MTLSPPASVEATIAGELNSSIDTTASHTSASITPCDSTIDKAVSGKGEAAGGKAGGKASGKANGKSSGKVSGKTSGEIDSGQKADTGKPEIHKAGAGKATTGKIANSRDTAPDAPSTDAKSPPASVEVTVATSGSVAQLEGGYTLPACAVTEETKAQSSPPVDPSCDTGGTPGSDAGSASNSQAAVFALASESQREGGSTLRAGFSTEAADAHFNPSVDPSCEPGGNTGSHSGSAGNSQAALHPPDAGLLGSLLQLFAGNEAGMDVMHAQPGTTDAQNMAIPSDEEGLAPLQAEKLQSDEYRSLTGDAQSASWSAPADEPSDDEFFREARQVRAEVLGPGSLMCLRGGHTLVCAPPDISCTIA